MTYRSRLPADESFGIFFVTLRCVKAIGKYRTLPKCQTTFNMAGYGVEGKKLRLKIFERGKNRLTADNAPGSVSFDGHTRGLIN